MMKSECKLCQTGEDDLYGKVFPREFVDIRGDKRWRHRHHSDQMWFTTCADQTPAE